MIVPAFEHSSAAAEQISYQSGDTEREQQVRSRPIRPMPHIIVLQHIIPLLIMARVLHRTELALREYPVAS
jgi:hypothetical protein